MPVVPAPLSLRRQDAAFKVETDTGVFEALAPTEAVTPVYNPKVRYQGSTEPLPKNGPSASSRGSLRMLESAQVSFTTKLYGKGSAGLPYHECLWRACGMQFTAQVLTPKTDPSTTLSFGHYLAGPRRKRAAGLMGSATVILENGVAGLINWDFLGVKVAADEIALATTPVYDTVIPPRVVSIGFSLEGASYYVPRIEIALTNTVVLRPSVNHEGYLAAAILDRNFRVRMSPEAVAGVDWLTAYNDRSKFTFDATVGTVANNKIQFQMPELQLVTDPDEEDREGLMADALEFEPVRATDDGDDEVVITYL